MTELRDLDADRRYVESIKDETGFGDLEDIASAALDEIERLKGLLVRQVGSHWHIGSQRLKDLREHPWGFPSEADAWVAVRKAASNAK